MRVRVRVVGVSVSVRIRVRGLGSGLESKAHGARMACERVQQRARAQVPHAHAVVCAARKEGELLHLVRVRVRARVRVRVRVGVRVGVRVRGRVR